MGQGLDFFISQRRKDEQGNIHVASIGDCVCTICKQNILVTDEHIRLLDCNHIYHRICMIHSISLKTGKRFFLTRKEQNELLKGNDEVVSLCPNCKIEDKEIGYLSKCFGYRKHIIYDLLKDKADIFFAKMKERRAIEIANAAVGEVEENSQDSENLSVEEET